MASCQLSNPLKIYKNRVLFVSSTIFKKDKSSEVKYIKVTYPKHAGEVYRFGSLGLMCSGTELQYVQEGVYERDMLVGRLGQVQQHPDGVEVQGEETGRVVQLYHSHHDLHMLKC